MAEELKLTTASGGPGEGQLSTGVDFLSRALKMFFGILRRSSSSRWDGS